MTKGHYCKKNTPLKQIMGLFVDIFPFDGYAGKMAISLGVLMARMLHFKTINMTWYKGNSFYEKRGNNDD